MYGFTGLLGKAVALEPYEITFWRTFLAAVVLLVIGKRLKDHSAVQSRQDFFTFLAIAGLLAVHWVLFFRSVQVSTVATALVGTYTYPILMVFLESRFFRIQLRLAEFISAVAVVFGIYYLTPGFDLSNETFQGVVYGVCAGMMIPFIILIRKKRIIHKYNSWDISAYEMGLVSLLLLPFMLYEERLFHYPGTEDAILLIVLGVVFTGFARILFIKSQKVLSGKIVGLTIVLEIIYGIVLAIVFLGAMPTQREVIGGLVVVSAVIFETLRFQREGSSGEAAPATVAESG